MKYPDSHTRGPSSLETVYYFASVINLVRLTEATRHFVSISAQYNGQSEAPRVITYIARSGRSEKLLMSCRHPTLFARVALLSKDGKPVPQGDLGEI